jgi:hypothetical protein
VAQAERWLLTPSATRHRMRAAGAEEQAERALASFWESRGWRLSAREQAYLDGVAALLAAGAVAASGRRLSEAPFAPIYRVGGRPVSLLGSDLAAGTRFAFDFREGHRALRTGLNEGEGVADAS